MTPTLDPISRAALHGIALDRPALNFFDGALLGNGGLGVVVCTRPDGIHLIFGHNSVWDIRVAEAHADKVGTFDELFKKIESIWKTGGSVRTDAWLAEYCKMAGQNYERPYPRPFPCGSILLGFDRRDAELLGHRLDLASGVCEVSIRSNGETVRVQIFADLSAERLWVRSIDARGVPCVAPFNRIKIMPDESGGAVDPSPGGWGQPGAAALGKLPAPQVLPHLPPNTLGYRQILRFQETCAPHAKDRAVRLVAHTQHPLGTRKRASWNGDELEMGPLERAITPGDCAFAMCVQLDDGLLSDVDAAPVDLPDPQTSIGSVLESNQKIWRDYWSRSAVAFDSDAELEGIWYRNLYFLRCALRPGVTCPGLFANWSYKNIGTAWHGDYHMNYNTQQPFWATFSSNHVELHLPYVDLVDHVLPISRKWAAEYYGLRGAYFPHSAYPTEMNIMPYWVPTWAWEICETPWTVQSLWWHYIYTLDEYFLRNRAIGPIREAVTFLVDYMMRPASHGEQWKDDKFHIFPTVAPELYGLTDRWEKNFDCLVDLTLTKFVFNAYLRATEVLGISVDTKPASLERAPAGNASVATDAELIPKVRHLLAHFPEYQIKDSPRGKVFVAAPDESVEIIYNCPNSTMVVFPGEEIGLESPKELYDLAVNTYRQHQNEGGNDLVHLNLQAARLGVLEIEKFKRQVRYSTTGNGASTDMVMQSQGRYGDDMPFDFMLGMGIWFENFGLPFVINESLLQSYTGTIRLFPNWDKTKPAEFRTLRGVGAFLVSARCADGAVQWVEIFSEKGGTLRLIDPWTGKMTPRETKAGETIRLERA